MNLSNSIFRPGLFSNKVAIVTGGATGIGKAISEELLLLGCSVMIASRNEQKLSEAANDLKRVTEKTARLTYTVCNIRKEEEVRKLMQSTIKNCGKIDYLVNNGGGQFLSKAENITNKGWHAVVETNLTGTFYCLREAYTQWFRDHGGAIVNITMDNYKGIPMMSHSGAARAGVENLTKSLALEWAENGVRVNSVAPGSCIYSDTAATNYGNVKIFDKVLPHIPAKRLGTPYEVSGPVCFLLSPAASFISGVTMHVGSGAHLYHNMYEIPNHSNSPKAYSLQGEPDEKLSKK